MNDYNDLRQFALHRIVHAELLHKPAKLHEGFDVDSYIREDLNTGSTIEQVQLVADIAANIAWLPRETPLSHQQSIEPIAGSDWFRLQAMTTAFCKRHSWSFLTKT